MGCWKAILFVFLLREKKKEEKEKLLSESGIRYRHQQGQPKSLLSNSIIISVEFWHM